MEDDKGFSICRLCLSGNGNLAFIFQSDVISGCVPADVISDLMQFQVSENDAYPQFACLECMGKLKDFKVFKEMCITSKELLDRAYTANCESIKGAYSEEIYKQNGICEDEETLRTLEVIAANATLLELKKESEECPVKDESDSDDNLSCISEWEEVCINPMSIPPSEGKTSDGDSATELVGEPTSEESDDYRMSNVAERDDITVNPPPVSLEEKQSATVSSAEPTNNHLSNLTIEKEAEIPENVLEDPINDSVLSDSRVYNLRQRKQMCDAFKCNECELSFASREEIITHMSIHMDRRTEGLVKKRLNGNINSKDYTEDSSRWKRQKIKHLPDIYWCDICGKILSSEHSLLTHKATHADEVVRSFGCNECYRMLASLPQLSIHVRSHRGALPFPCPICNVRFSVKCDLHNHFKTLHIDSKEATYNCADCGFLNADNQGVELSVKESGDAEELNDEFNCDYRCPVWTIKKAGEVVENLLQDPVVDRRIHDLHEPDRMFEHKGSELTVANTEEIANKVSVDAVEGILEVGKKRLGCEIISEDEDILEAEPTVELPYNAGKKETEGSVNVRVRKRKGLQCPACDKVYKDPRSFGHHVLAHRNGKMYKCPHCEKRYDLEKSLWEHIKLKHSEGKYDCNICGKKFKYRYVLEKHVQMHGERRFKCDVCDRTYCKYCDLRQHKKTHIVGKTNVCEICGKSYNIWVHFLKHLQHHKSNALKFVCDICRKTCSSKVGLQSHLKMHSSKFSCPICEIDLPNKMSLKYHMERHESGQERRLLDCDQCGKKYATAGILEQHKKIRHLGVKEFSCQYCGNEFTQKHSMKYHIKKKHPEKYVK